MQNCYTPTWHGHINVFLADINRVAILTSRIESTVIG